MRKRGKPRKRYTLVNPLEHVLHGFTPLRNVRTEVMDLKLKNHAALAALAKGEGKESDVLLIIQALNIASALISQKIGWEYEAEVVAAKHAVLALGERSLKLKGRYVLKGDELGLFNTALELHDAQLDVCTVEDMETAINTVLTLQRRGKVDLVKRYKGESA